MVISDNHNKTIKIIKVVINNHLLNLKKEKLLLAQNQALKKNSSDNHQGKYKYLIKKLLINLH